MAAHRGLFKLFMRRKSESLLSDWFCFNLFRRRALLHLIQKIAWFLSVFFLLRAWLAVSFYFMEGREALASVTILIIGPHIHKLTSVLSWIPTVAVRWFILRVGLATYDDRRFAALLRNRMHSFQQLLLLPLLLLLPQVSHLHSLTKAHLLEIEFEPCRVVLAVGVLYHDELYEWLR